MSSLAAFATATGVQDPVPRRRRVFQRGERRSRPAAVTRPPVFGTGPATRQVHSPCRLSRPMRADGRWRKTGDSNARTTAPTRFPVGDHHLVISSSKRGRRPTRTAQSPAHPLATEPGTPVRFTFRERLTGFEPATSSMVRKRSIEVSISAFDRLPLLRRLTYQSRANGRRISIT